MTSLEKTLLISAVLMFFGVFMSGALDNSLDIKACQAHHSHDTCFNALNR